MEGRVSRDLRDASPHEAIALQMYSVADLAERDMVGTLRRVAAMGYHAVELAGYGDSSARTIRAALDQLGLRAVASHLELSALETQTASTINDLLELGCQYGVLAWLEPSLYATDKIARQTVARIARAADALQQAGVMFAYHNHDFEFGRLGRTTLWDMILESTDPDTLRLEVDIYWVRHAGRLPAELIREVGPRVSLIHAKDTSPISPGQDCAIGDGVEDWPAVIAEARRAGVDWLIVEQEHSLNMLADVERSLGALSGYLRRAQ